MCDPISMGSLAVGAAGQALSGYENAQNQAAQINARNAATQAELARQKQYGEQSRASFDKSVGVYAPGAQDSNLAGSQASIGDALTRNAPTAESVGTITTAGAPRVVADSEGKKLADVFSYGAGKDTNLANLKGYDQANFNNNVALNSNARDIDTIGDFAKTSAGVNQIEQRAAQNNAARPLSPLGSLLSFAGAVGANQAGRGNLSMSSLPQTSLFNIGFAGPYV
jgi:hypothetical protein